MPRSRVVLLGSALVSAVALSGCYGSSGEAEQQGVDGEALYQGYCAVCHGTDRLGGTGPALLPENLRRLSKDDAYTAIGEGLAATQMPVFGDVLDSEQITALVDYIYEPLDEVPQWRIAEMEQTHTVFDPPEAGYRDDPVFDADMENLFVVVETGDHHATILDGDRFEPLHRFGTHHTLHGGPKYSPDGRFVYFVSRDGWVTRFDLYNLHVTHEIRAGINARNVALSADGRFVVVGNYLPHTLVVLDARDLTPLKSIPVAGAADGKSSRVSAVYQSAPRGNFIAALRDVPEIWELYYDDTAPPDAEPAAGEGPGEGFHIRRIVTEEHMDDFFFDPDHGHVLGSARDSERSLVIDLDRGEAVAEVEIEGMPHLASGITWEHRGRTVMATPHLHDGMVSVVDTVEWEVIARIETEGPGFFLRSHENSQYAWVDVFFGPNRDLMHVIDKETFEIVETLRPEPGKTAAHVEFTRDGSHALVSIWEMDGALVIFDAETLEEVERLPMRKPSGKYNVSNKIYRSPGTSH